MDIIRKANRVETDATGKPIVKLQKISDMSFTPVKMKTDEYERLINMCKLINRNSFDVISEAVEHWAETNLSESQIDVLAQVNEKIK